MKARIVISVMQKTCFTGNHFCFKMFFLNINLQIDSLPEKEVYWNFSQGNSFSFGVRHFVSVGVSLTGIVFS